MELTGTQKRLYDYLAERIARDGRARTGLLRL